MTDSGKISSERLLALAEQAGGFESICFGKTIYGFAAEELKKFAELVQEEGKQ
ncbi:MAG: hypothetical protein JWR21_939 [Herminiimonas sp.]|nr:hypothetical protein [Herminiimonas sp.]